MNGAVFPTPGSLLDRVLIAGAANHVDDAGCYTDEQETDPKTNIRELFANHLRNWANPSKQSNI